MTIRGASLWKRLKAGGLRTRLLVLVCAYLMTEVLLMPLVAREVPLRLRAKIGSVMYVAGESSSSRLVPEDYVLVLGDSYAEGHGDWLTAALRDGGNPPFQATHVLHERTGRDVISFGRGGADNVSSIAFLSEKRFASLRRLGWSDPSDVLIYFYAGNDLNENLRQARKRLGLGERHAGDYSVEELDSFVASRARSGFWKGLPGTLFVPGMFSSLVRGGSAGGMNAAGYEHHVQGCDQSALDDPGSTAFRSGGELMRFCVPIQGPALELDPDETDLALRLFERALAWAKQRFTDSRVSVVYIPSPLSCYELVSENVRAQAYEGRGESWPASLVWPRSDELRGRVTRLVEELDLTFLDMTPELRALARDGLIHGPADGKHFNRTGYTALADAIAAELLGRHE